MRRLVIRLLPRPDGVDVSVRNGGRPGRITYVECSRGTGGGQSNYTGVDAAINSVATQVIYVNLLPEPGGMRCTAHGANEDGAAEVNTTNNSYSVAWG
jgi:hypothetical protein